VLADYPDQALIKNMAYNVAQNVEPAARHVGTVSVMGYVWGQPVEPLLALLQSEDRHGEDINGGGQGGFDLILLSDLYLIILRCTHFFLLYRFLI
jgi:EEF1A N-terminal glycine/lysine methyltransferase